MAKNRQRAKQRQAQRRAERLREGDARSPGAPRPGEDGAEAGDGAAAPGDSGPRSGDERGEPAGAFPADRGGEVPAEVGVETGADLAASAPPEAAGRSDTVVETQPPPLAADPEADPEAAASRGDPSVADAEGRPETRDRNKVVAFLIAVWAELGRVQWPNRPQVTTLTGVVLGFVIIMGAYLGTLDAIFSRLVQAII